MLARMILILIVLFLTPCFAEERIHSYTDENGTRVYYTTNDKKEKNAPAPFTKPDYESKKIESYESLRQREIERNNNVFTWKRDSSKPMVNPMQQSAPSMSSFNSIVAALVGQIMLVIIFGGILLIFWLIALVDVLKNEFTGSNKIVWLLLLVFLSPLGTILYFIIGKGQKVTYQHESSEDPELTTRSYRKPEI